MDGKLKKIQKVNKTRNKDRFLLYKQDVNIEHLTFS